MASNESSSVPHSTDSHSQPTITTSSGPSSSVNLISLPSLHPSLSTHKSTDVKVSNVPLVSLPPQYINSTIPSQSIPHSQRNRLPGHTLVKIPHYYDSTLPVIEELISNDDLQFELRPKYLGSYPNNYFIYYDAADVEWYKQQLPNPKLIIWILIKNTSFTLNTVNNIGYVKRRLVETAIKHNIQIYLMNPDEFDLAVSTAGLTSVVYRGKAIKLPDAVIPRVGANVDYFGLAVLRQLEALGVKVFNPVDSIEVSRDKLYTHQVLAANGIPIPTSILSRMPFEYEYVAEHFTYPIILKLASGSRGEAVWKSDSPTATSLILDSIDKSKPIIVQEFLKETRGRDIRCLVVGDRVVASCMRVAGTGFKANFHAGGSVLPITIPSALEALVLRTASLCGLTFTGVDILLSPTSYRVCEVNSSPGFEGLERASQVNCAEAMIVWVEKWVEEERARIREGKGEKKVGVKIRVFPLQEDHKQVVEEIKQQRIKEKEELERKETEEKTNSAGNEHVQVSVPVPPVQ